MLQHQVGCLRNVRTRFGTAKWVRHCVSRFSSGSVPFSWRICFETNRTLLLLDDKCKVSLFSCDPQETSSPSNPMTWIPSSRIL